MRGRPGGFTLIELLVVIAVISILAAMLFPVFARSRESARKIQCLSNVMNITAAFLLYLTDYERLPPDEYRQEVLDYLDTHPGGGDPASGCITKWTARNANPYLRWPVVLEEYVRNRDVWRCPSARLKAGATWIVPGPDWLAALKAHQGEWGIAGDYLGGPCHRAWPPGWGGAVTDSLTQHMLASLGGRGRPSTGAFEQTVATTTVANHDLKPSSVQDPSWLVLCGDGGAAAEICFPQQIAFPDVCKAQCGAEEPGCGCTADWVNCPHTKSCGIDYTLKHDFWEDPELRKRSTRHLGGSNIGFLDGHAAWFSADAIIAASPSDADPDGGRFRGMGCVCRYAY